MVEEEQQQPPLLHALVLPYPGQGHINPMLHLSALLSSRGCLITFVNTHRSHCRMLEAQQHLVFNLPNIQFVSIPDGITQDVDFCLDTAMESLFMMLDAIEKQQGHIEQLILNSRQQSQPEAGAAVAAAPITCIIADSFFPWTQDVANKLGISQVMFWASNVTSLYAARLSTTKRMHSEDTEADLPVGKDELLSTTGAMNPKRLDFAMRRFKGIDETACILVNSLQGLEMSFMRAIDLKAPIRCVGPLFAHSDAQIDRVKPTSVSARASLFMEEVKCLHWLDEQPVSSVLYVAFGSVVSFSLSQVEQLALGIEASKQRFLWVARSDAAAGTSMFPEGFVDHTKGRGLIISWAPQLRVLEHPAISCFLTHCGWNSVLESIFMGIPMLCLPSFADQPMNEKLVVKVWKVGMSLERGKDGEANWKAVEKGVMGVMHSEEGRKVREAAKWWRAVARDAVSQGGVSYTEVTQFVEDMVGLSDKRLGLKTHLVDT